MLLALALVVWAGAMVVPAEAARGTGTRDCGPVTPPLPPGLHDGYSFFKVTAKNVSCRMARHVARRYVEVTNHSTPPMPVDRTVLGFACIPPPTVGPARCRRGRKLVVGDNGGF
jgi:hypothetical protein